MNNHSLNDPVLQSLEARLAAATPQISSAEQHRILYQCAFAAGQQSGRRSIRRWRFVSAALVVLFLGWSFTAARDQRSLVKSKPAPATPTEVRPQQMIGQTEVSLSARQIARVELDAWQIPAGDHGSFADELVQQTDPHLRSLTVGAFSRSLLQP